MWGIHYKRGLPPPQFVCYFDNGGHSHIYKYTNFLGNMCNYPPINVKKIHIYDIYVECRTLTRKNRI